MSLSLSTRRPQDRTELAAWYRAALDDHFSGGVSIATIAAQLGVTTTTLYSWRRKLSTDTACPDSRSDLVQIDIKPRPQASDGARFVVRLAAAQSIEVPCGFDADELLRLITVLESC